MAADSDGSTKKLSPAVVHYGLGDKQRRAKRSSSIRLATAVVAEKSAGSHTPLLSYNMSFTFSTTHQRTIAIQYHPKLNPQRPY